MDNPANSDSGADAREVCPSCGLPLAPAARYCSTCGMRVDEILVVETPSADAGPTQGNGASEAESATGSGVESEEETAERDTSALGSGPWPQVAPKSTHGTVIIRYGIRDASNIGELAECPPVLDGTLTAKNGDVIRVVLCGEGDRFVIGRDGSQCDAVVTDPRVSRVHLAIRHGEGTAVVEDLGSTNGTYVNGERIDGRGVLRDGDTIKLGRTEIEFRSS